MFGKFSIHALMVFVATVSFFGSRPVMALDTNGNGISWGTTDSVGNCFLEASVSTDINVQSTFVVLGSAYAGNIYYPYYDQQPSQYYSGAYPNGLPITPTQLASCFPGSTPNEFAITFQGAIAPGATARDVEYLGFRFDYRGCSYEYAFKGVTNTNWVAEDCTSTNAAPTANAGPDQPNVASGAGVTLDGTGSSDPENQTLTYAWTAPAGVTLSDATAASPTFTAPTLAVGDANLTLTFSLIVTDSLGLASVADTVTVTVASGLSVTLSGGPDAITGTDPFSLTATFSKNVTGFDNLASDVIVTNGTVTAISGGPAIYTLTITPTGNGDVSITIPVAAAQDSVGSANSVSNTLVIGNRIAEITQEQIAGYMLGRANNLASNQPGLTRFLMGEGCGAFSASASGESGSVSGCVMRANTWAEINSSWSGNGSYTLGTIGAHSILNPNLLVGGMIQFDYADDPANNASGHGFMVGPYFVAKTPDKPLYLEGRLLYGQSDNDITPLGTYTDSFETDRWLAQLRATGEYKLQNTTLMPLLDVTYTEDNQRAYTDSLGNTIPGQTVDLMQVRAGLDFSTPIPVRLGSLKLTGGISGIYSSSKGAAAAPVFENWRGRTHLGLDYDTGAGTTVRFGSFYDGLGTDYESYGADLSFEMRF